MKTSTLRKKIARLQKLERKATNSIILNFRWNRNSSASQKLVQEKSRQLEDIISKMNDVGIEPREESLILLVETVMET